MSKQSALGLTANEHEMMSRLMSYSSREKHGNGPWERSWMQARNSLDGRTLASLARKGLIERTGGSDTAKISPRYRWRRKP